MTRKATKLGKKLNLSKETLRSLTDDQIAQVQGMSTVPCLPKTSNAGCPVSHTACTESQYCNQ